MDTIISCQFCNKTLGSKRSLDRHHQTCKKKSETDIENKQTAHERKIIELGELDTTIEDFETSNSFLLLDKNLDFLRNETTLTNTTKPLSKVASTTTLFQADVENNLKSIESCLAETLASDTFSNAF